MVMENASKGEGESTRRSKISLPERFNIVEELLEKPASSVPNSVAIREVSPTTLEVVRTYTYVDLYRSVNKIANSLRESNILPEQRIGIMMDDGVDFVSAFLAILKVGAVAVMLNTYVDEAWLKFILNDSYIRGLFIGKNYLPKLVAVRNDLRHTRLVVSTTEADGTRSLEEFVRHSSPVSEVESVSRDDIAFWYFTSGSTGRPKGVAHHHHDMYYAGLAYYDDTLRARSKDIFFSSAKLYFSAGMGFGLYGPFLIRGSTVLYPGKLAADTLLQIISRAKPTLFLAVPTIYARMLEAIVLKKFDVSSVRIFVAGGEFLPPQVFQKWKDTVGIEITDGMGAAEVCHYFTSNIPGQSRPVTCGRMIEGYEARIVGADGKDVKEGDIGSLLVKGKSTFAYYWHMDELTKRTKLGEWVSTGDLVYRDKEGYIYFCGREDHSFKIHGLWVSPIEIENEILSTEIIRECCVVSLTTANGIAEPVAYLVANSLGADKEKITEEIKGRLKAKLSGYKIPKGFVFLGSLPKTSVDKLDRSTLLKEASRYFTNL
jgi:benzoate-CoA ligase family protein